MDSVKLPPLSKPPSVWTEYGQRLGERVLRGLSQFCAVPELKASEVQLFSKISMDSENISSLSGEAQLQKIAEVMERAIALMKQLCWRGGVATAAIFFAGRVLSILPFIPAISYLFGTATLLVTRDLYLATQQMKYAQAYFHSREFTGCGGNVPSYEVVCTIDRFARARICDMLLFGRDESDLTFFGDVSKLLSSRPNGEQTLSVNPSRVAQIFFPPLKGLIKMSSASLNQ